MVQETDSQNKETRRKLANIMPYWQRGHQEAPEPQPLSSQARPKHFLRGLARTFLLDLGLDESLQVASANLRQIGHAKFLYQYQHAVVPKLL